jgi:Ca2+-binding RTX toxin-like protein
LSSATDERYARGGGTEFDYNIKLADSHLAAGVTLTVSGALLMPNETMLLDGGLESDGILNLFGGRAADTLKGGGQGDLLHGNLGADLLTGNGGADVFRYDSIAESNNSSLDQILDFTPGTDKIDLSRIDANANAGGDQAFTWIGSNAFSGTAGELRVENLNNMGWLVQGDTDGNGVGDFSIILTLVGPAPFGAGDFIL